MNLSDASAEVKSKRLWCFFVVMSGSIATWIGLLTWLLLWDWQPFSLVMILLGLALPAIVVVWLIWNNPWAFFEKKSGLKSWQLRIGAIILSPIVVPVLVLTAIWLELLRSDE